MDVSQLRAHIDNLQSVLAKRIHEQRAHSEDQLSRLDGYTSKRASAAVKAVPPRKRAKAKPKYQSKKNKSLKWSGRGVTPLWMREEMKGTKLKKEDFAIKRSAWVSRRAPIPI